MKADRDAHILLANCDGCDGYEIVIGAHGNRETMIRKGIQKAAVTTPVGTNMSIIF